MTCQVGYDDETKDFTKENYTFRLPSGQDLFDSIESFVKEKHIEAGCVLSPWEA